MTQTFLVSGGTGRIGTAFVHEMASRGHRVRVGTRKPQGAAARLRMAFGPGTVTPCSLDPTDASALDRAFDGVTGALLVAPFEGMQPWHEAMGRAAHAAGVAHLVKVSVTGARSAESTPAPGRLPLAHFEGEEALMASGVATTVIRPTMFGQHFLGLSPALFSPGADAIHLPTGEGSVAFLDCRDIAACASALLLDPGKRAEWAGERFELTGPEALTGAAIATLLTQVAGRAISWVDGVDAFSARAAALGVSDGLKHIYAEAADGWFSRVETDAFQRITGRHPTSFAKLAFDHAAYFAGS